MKIFTFLTIVAFAEALTPAQQNAAERAFRKFDHDHNGKIASGAVYGALSQLDKKLTEAQLQKAAGHNKVFFFFNKCGALSPYTIIHLHL